MGAAIALREDFDGADLRCLASGAFVHCMFLTRRRPNVINILPWWKIGDKPFDGFRTVPRRGCRKHFGGADSDRLKRRRSPHHRAPHWDLAGIRAVLRPSRRW